MKHLYIISALLFLCNSIQSQTTFNKEIDLYVGIDNITKNIASIDSFFYTLSIKFCPEDSTIFKECTVISKFDKEGVLIKYLVIDTLHNAFESPMINVGNKLYVCGRLQSDEDKSGAIIYELDKNLNVLDQTTIELSEHASVNVRSIQIINGRKYIYGTIIDLSLSKANAFLGCWQDSCSMKNIQLYPAKDLNVYMSDLQSTPDGNLAFILMHKSAAGPDGKNGYEIFKVDSFGEVIKSYFFEDFIGSSINFSLTIGTNGKYYFYSELDPTNINKLSIGRINKFDILLDSLEWTSILPNDSLTFGRRYQIYNTKLAKSGDILVCGKVLDDEDPSPGYDINSIYTGFICRVSSEGEVIWIRLYKFPNTSYYPLGTYGKYKESVIIDIKELEDGSILAGGNSKLTGKQKQHEDFDILEDEYNLVWLMKVDSTGCLEGEECEEVIHFKSNTSSKFPIIDTSKQWNMVFHYLEEPDKPSEYTRLFFTNDTFQFGNHFYYPLISANELNSTEGEVFGYFREEDNILYKYIREVDDEYKYYDIPLGDKEFYNFNLTVGDTIKDYYMGTYHIVVNEIDSLELEDGSKRKRISLECLDGSWRSTSQIVEGIGDLESAFYGPYNLCGSLEEIHGLLCYFENEEIKYGNEVFGCWRVGVDNEETSLFSIIPNPVNHTIIINSLDFQNDKYQIFNHLGQLMQQGKIGKTIDVNTFSDGTYTFFLFNTKGEVSRQRFVKIGN